MFQSRFGFHPCDYQTYRKLKFLNQVCLKAIRLAHAWTRWKRKDPQNRVSPLRLSITEQARSHMRILPPGAQRRWRRTSRASAPTGWCG